MAGILRVGSFTRARSSSWMSRYALARFGLTQDAPIGYRKPAASNGSFKLKKAEYTNSVLRLNRYFDDKADWDEGHCRSQ